MGWAHLHPEHVDQEEEIRMGDRVSANPARSRVGRRADGRKRPPDFADSDIVDAILAEVEWEDEGNPDAALDGWWSNRWASPARHSAGDD